MTCEQDDDTESFPTMDRFADAIALCNLAANAKTIKARVRALAKLDRQVADAEAKLASLQAQAAGIVQAALAQAQTIRDEAQRRLETAATAEDELAEREQKIARLESAWRGLGEPQDVLSGFKSPEYSPLQKARLSHGAPAGKNLDPLFLSEPDTEPAAAIDAMIRRDVGDARSDAQGNAFAPSTLHRDLSHKRGTV